MKFLAVFVALVAVGYGQPVASSWTLDELSMALQNPATDPALIPYLEAALNEMMEALHHGQHIESITVVMPADKPDLIDVWPIQDPAGEGSDHIDVWPIQDPAGEGSDHIDVWPIQDPTESSPVEVTPAEVPAPAASNPLVQIIVNVQKQQVADVSPVAVAEESEIIPTPVNVVEEAFVPADHVWGGGWGPMI